MAALIHEARLFFIALQFFTRVPVPAWVGYTPEWMHASARHYPLVGAWVGGVAALVLWLAAQVWPLSVAVGLSMAATVWLTGGFHEDGLADTCDGLGGSVSRERALTIMKDSRLGSYGALGLVGVLGLKAVALYELTDFDGVQALIALVWAHAVSRAVPVALLRLLPYAGDAEQADGAAGVRRRPRGCARLGRAGLCGGVGARSVGVHAGLRRTRRDRAGGVLRALVPAAPGRLHRRHARRGAAVVRAGGLPRLAGGSLV